ncbi:DUF4376 domain-containing protein [Brevundimonas subvibrioides]|uniref:DUF4376 domain-containing protein n=1 Tax=Brevundimonas subvibrioides (strain ATCC 15264 / DSM 4735 / LMG 14903 / NBRC 16000 / CB 81) TaxID=633149 RepID=D9QI77_BRESC|nr:DUF4376 domain-containing protein [Brevundimonas subvibrioides]ADK99379.1 hypothetical protein Bresu_0065 [Brevundimonas subvibrioides ATCC 15264]
MTDQTLTTRAAVEAALAEKMAEAAAILDGAADLYPDGLPANLDRARRFAATTAAVLAVTTQPTVETVSREIDRERDRRIDSGFTFDGHRYQSRASDRENIMGAAQLAMGALAQGAQAGDLRWADPDQDFVWITADNELVPLDAPQVLALFQAGVAFKSALTFHARGLKDAAAEAADVAAFDWRTGWPE